MVKPHILQIGSYPEWDQAPLDTAYTAHRYFEAEDKLAMLREIGPEIRAIATRGDLGATRELIVACPKLEMISIYGAGTDGVDLVAARERGIHVSNTPDVLTNDVAVARRLAAFDMDIAYTSRAPKQEGKQWTYIADPLELARHADFLFVTLAASAETRHIINRGVIEAVGPQGMIINISSAANIDEDALLDALESRRLGSAALDVFDGEPKLNARFLQLDNVLLQPHHASGTFETRKATGQSMRDNLSAHFAGKPLLTPVV